MLAHHLQNMSLIKNNYSSIIDRELVVFIDPLLELVMIKTRKALVTVRIISDLNRHGENSQATLDKAFAFICGGKKAII